VDSPDKVPEVLASRKLPAVRLVGDKQWGKGALGGYASGPKNSI